MSCPAITDAVWFVVPHVEQEAVPWRVPEFVSLEAFGLGHLEHLYKPSQLCSELQHEAKILVLGRQGKKSTSASVLKAICANNSMSSTGHRTRAQPELSDSAPGQRIRSLVQDFALKVR